ncbi:MAG: energy-coupling factor transporter transmembrane protein EcfT [Neorhizobium sp.]|nr:energy-coupling factor transporter transmembrane protein EcfT [Neorhizobium sp.]
MKTLYHDGDTALHRLSPRVKLIGLAVTSVVLFWLHSPVALGIAAFASIIVFSTLKLKWSEIRRQLRPLVVTLGLVCLFTLAFNGSADALTVFLRLGSLMLLAAAVTATTGIGDFIDEITLAAMPLERLGILRAADVGLAIGLVIRFVPEVVSRYKTIREAHLARGLRPRPLTVAVPLIILTLRSADEIAAAIDARGIRRQK